MLRRADEHTCYVIVATKWRRPRKLRFRTKDIASSPILHKSGWSLPDNVATCTHVLYYMSQVIFKIADDEFVILISATVVL